MMRDAALEYARRVPVFPVWGVAGGRCRCDQAGCGSPGKHPLGTLVPTGFRSATTDETTIRAWWAQYPDANIGTPTSWCVVLDVDVRKGGDAALAALEARHGALPDTPAVLTGGGGKHFYFAVPAVLVGNSAGKLATGLDVRGVGGYVVLPPSTHVSGGVYMDDILHPLFETPLATMPAWLLALLAAPSSATNGDGSTEAIDWAALLTGAPEGQRHQVAAQIAGHFLGKRLPVAEVTGILRGFAALCTPPMPPSEARRIVRDLAAKDRARHAAPAAARPLIPISGNLAAMASAAWAALTAANEPPVLFCRGASVPVRFEDAGGTPRTRLLTPDRMRHALARASRWERLEHTRKGTRAVEALPPVAVVLDLLATPTPPLPALDRIVTVPTFTPTGRLRETPGYDSDGHTYYAPPAELIVPPIPAHPTPAGIAQAARLLLDEYLGEFPFTGPAERAHALALLLLPFLRELIDGPTPLHLIEAPTPGTGKTLLVDALGWPALGHATPAMAEGRDDDEWRKRIYAKLLASAPAVNLDNLRRPLDSSAVSSAITATLYEDRILGRSEIEAVPVRCSWSATGNNPRLSLEMARRTVRIRLDAKTEEPWRRTGFRLADIRGWAHEHRGRLIAAALTLGQGWLDAGRPAGTRTLGMFESWTRVIGGVLKVAGIDGFLGNLDEFYEDADLEGHEIRAFLDAWWAAHRDAPVTAALLLSLEALPSRVTDGGKGREDRGRSTRLGKLLSSLRDRQYRLADLGAVRVTRAGVQHSAARWRLTGGGG
jgi:hypothetical protein